MAGVRKFWIDVGGTFTDVICVTADGSFRTHKVLSSGVVKAHIESLKRTPHEWNLRAAILNEHSPHLYKGYTATLLDEQGAPIAQGSVAEHHAHEIAFPSEVWTNQVAARARDLELTAGEPAPVLAMRQLLGTPLDQDLGEVDVRLGTTRGTNALLERKGARTAFVTTKGFGDILAIGTQDRPELFNLRIEKPSLLYETAVELDERLAADGTVLRALDEAHVRAALTPIRERGIDALAVCLLHAWRNGIHEKMVACVAEDLGFTQVSISSEVAPSIKLVSRGDTTVVDAYLTPILRTYIALLREAMPCGRLRLMTSAGGLVDASAFGGKDSILSGPAGGVVGAAQTARAAGIDKIIGFDMGGTSTDVSRYDGRYEYQFETRKVGARIATPMLAIETVAAGGGSLCRFDGQKLVVGPESAGADPGPACYGRGGPLAVTDINVFLGKVPADRFPFALDRDAVEARLAEVAEKLSAATGRPWPLRKIATGFERIANEQMAAPIKRISIARGYDVRDYTLACFGGAGGQHACGVARLLGMRSVMLHPFSGVLSAYGMGLADVKRLGEVPVLDRLAAETWTALRPRIDELRLNLERELLNEGLPHEGLQAPSLLFDLRYQGQDAALTIETALPPPTEDPVAFIERLVRAFESAHEQTFGHTHPGRAMEWVAARVEVAAALDQPPWPVQPLPSEATIPKAMRTQALICNGKEASAAVYDRAQLSAGDTVNGPAIMVEATGTIVVDPGWRATLTHRGDLMLTDTVGMANHLAEANDGATIPADPVQLEVFHQTFAHIAEQMGTQLQRTAMSTNVKERLDYSCAVFTANGELVANAPHVPVHLGAMGECVQAVLRDLPDLADGDVAVTNDPFRGGSHLPDVTVITPVFNADGQRLFFTASRAHHAEIGGTRPGSMPPDSRSLADEGVLIRPFKLVEAGVSREETLRKLLKTAPYPSRAVDQNLADIRAQTAATRHGARELLALAERHGATTVRAYMGHIRDAAEAKLRAALARRPDGTRTFEDILDDGSPIRARVTITGDRAEIDFTGSAPVSSGNLNANRAIVSSAVLYVLRCLIDEDLPLNAGVLAPVTLRVPEGLLNPPAHEQAADCVAVVGGNVETSQRIVDVLLGALELCAASQGTMNNFLFGDATFGYYETICGGAGAGDGYHGADAVHTHMTNTRLTDPEVLETRYPVRLRRFAIRKGSGGAGRYRGGDGIEREVEFLSALDVSLLTGRRVRAPYGLHGGADGAKGENLIKRKGSTQAEPLPWLTHLTVAPGDVLILRTPGGGGYGAPA